MSLIGLAIFRCLLQDPIYLAYLGAKELERGADRLLDGDGTGRVFREFLYLPSPIIVAWLLWMLGNVISTPLQRVLAQKDFWLCLFIFYFSWAWGILYRS
jgi:hypothetical protein